MKDINVIKRNGSSEPYNSEKINKMLLYVTKGINGVSPTDIAFNAELNLRDGVTTDEIQRLLIKSANDLISEESPNYQYVASKLLLVSLRKEAWGNGHPPKLLHHIKELVKLGKYDDDILSCYTEKEINKLETYVKHHRDDLFTYAGLQQFVDKYLLKDRNTGQIYETPQFAYMCIAMILCKDEANKLKEVKKTYDCFSTFKISLPTPILSGVRTKIRQFSSCILIDCDDSLDSIFTSASIAGKYTARRAGIGINMGRIRPIGSPIRHGEVIHTGIIPYLKVMESAVKSTSQNGIRGGSATVSVPWWHYEIEDIMQLKNNGGTDDNRVRKLDYCVQFDKTFYKALVTDDYVYLFSPNECAELYDKFGTDQFEEEYEKCVSKKSLQFKKKVKALDLAAIFARERLETGRIYSMNIDHVNQHGSWKEKVNMTNLCCEITQPTIPSTKEQDENALIGVCTLGAINLLENKTDEDLEKSCRTLVRCLDTILDYQDYPFISASNFARKTRSLGVGITNLAAYLASHKILYTDSQAPQVVSDLMEKIQFYLLKASCGLAEEKGQCEYYHMTKYSDGLLPIDWCHNSTEKINSGNSLDWEKLREDIKLHGLRNCTVSAQMPCESSSVIQNATNGIEPVRALLSYKKAKNGKLKQLVPYFNKFKNYYSLAFDIPNDCILAISSALQKWIDMGISTNLYYNYDNYEGGIIPLSVIMKDQLTAYKMGIKNIYYANTPDGDNESSCVGGSCSV